MTLQPVGDVGDSVVFAEVFVSPTSAKGLVAPARLVTGAFPKRSSYRSFLGQRIARAAAAALVFGEDTALDEIGDVAQRRVG